MRLGLRHPCPTAATAATEYICRKPGRRHPSPRYVDSPARRSRADPPPCLRGRTAGHGPRATGHGRTERTPCPANALGRTCRSAFSPEQLPPIDVRPPLSSSHRFFFFFFFFPFLSAAAGGCLPAALLGAERLCPSTDGEPDTHLPRRRLFRQQRPRQDDAGWSTSRCGFFCLFAGWMGGV